MHKKPSDRMKHSSVILAFIVCSNVCFANSVDSLLKVLDAQIKKDNLYVAAKENNIAVLKKNLKKENLSNEDRYLLNKSLFQEYKSYQSDSAIACLNRNLDICRALNNPYKMNETNLSFAALFRLLGLYPEALDALSLVRKDRMDHAQQVKYYSCNMDIYWGIAHYTQDNKRKRKYWQLHDAYRDSLLKIMIAGSPEYLQQEENRLREAGMTNGAIAINDLRLQSVATEKEEYALVMFHRSLIYRKTGEVEKQKECLLRSTIADIECAIKDNASISILANILFEEGDVERSYNYIRFLLNNTSLYNTRLRSTETLAILNIIDKAYHEKSRKQSRKLHISFLFICALFLILIVLSCFIYRQMRRKANINKYVMKTNQQLNVLNLRLKDMNLELEKNRMEMIESNKIKEEYIGYFLNQCLQYIDKMDDYRKMVNKKILEKQIEQLYRITKSTTLREDELKALFRNFDTMFLNLFPNFVSDFNALLADEEQISLKKGEILNVELRIYALIRLGISDSAKIADFFGYSVNTIYNYRAKMKNRAKYPREDFEWLVKQTGTFNKVYK
jgi:hypothetical protein